MFPGQKCLKKEALSKLVYQICTGFWLEPLSPNEINRRTLAYARKGMCVLWTPPIQETLLPQRTEMDENERYTPSAWERYLHVLYFGKVYYWHSGEKLLPIRYEDHFIHIKKWRDKGGYDRLSKKFKTFAVLLLPRWALSL